MGEEYRGELMIGEVMKEEEKSTSAEEERRLRKLGWKILVLIIFSSTWW